MSMSLTHFLSSTEAPQEYTIVPDESHLTILNPSLAERKSMKIRLQNGLEAYLISDPKAEQSAAALSVESGSWQDPKEYPGMAHFLEHMLFLGTKAYPKENEYDQFISDNGGTMNAATYPDHTVYMFSTNNEAFNQGLNRFSHFFIDPLLSTSCINRELHAVDQEHAKNVENDYRRLYMIFKETGNQAHPNASFSTGNAKTLSGIPQAALREWYLANYHASKMHLFAISTHSIEEMVKQVVLNFSSIQNAPQEATPITESLVSDNQLGHFIYVKPIKDLRELSLMWEVPREFCGDLERTSIELIAYALRIEGKNSLLEQLKKEKLADKISIGIDRQDKNTLFFNIDVELTPQGIAQLNGVITRIFQAIATLKEKGIPSSLFDEMQKMALYNYQYQSRHNAFKIAMKTANELLYEKLATYPLKTTQPVAYDPSSIEAFLTTLKPSNCVYFVLADPLLTKMDPVHTEKWTRAEYTTQKISSDQLTTWTKEGLHPTFDLPTANPFIPKQLVLSSATTSNSPHLILDDPLGKIYHLQDAQYRIPTLSALFNIKSPVHDGSAKHTVLTTLFLKSLKEKLSSLFSYAENAGLHPTFAIDNLNIVLGVYGYSEKAPLLIQEIFNHLKSVAPTATEFDLYKEALLSTYDNASHELPIIQALEILKGLLSHDAPTNKQRYTALKSISYEEFIQFSEQLFKQAYIEGFLYGNLNESEARHLSSTIKSSLNAEPYHKDKHHQRRILQLQEKTGPYLLTHSTPRQGNGVLLMLSQGAFSFEKRAAQQLLAKVLKNAFYDTLRTKQQTAYITLAVDKEEEKELFQYFGVQSSTHQTGDLLARFDLFLEDFIKNFSENISTERFEALKKSIITTLELPPENLASMGERLFSLAFQYGGEFDWFDKRIMSFRNLTYENLYKLAVQSLSRENAKRLAIFVEGVLEPEHNFQYKPLSHEKLTDTFNYVHIR